MMNSIFSSNKDKLFFSYSPLTIIEKFQYYNLQCYDDLELVDILNSYIANQVNINKSSPTFLAFLCEEIKSRDVDSSCMFENDSSIHTCVDLSNLFYISKGRMCIRFY